MTSSSSNVVTYTQLISRQSFEATFEFGLGTEATFDSSTLPIVEGPIADEQHDIINYRIQNDSKH